MMVAFFREQAAEKFFWQYLPEYEVMRDFSCFIIYVWVRYIILGTIIRRRVYGGAIYFQAPIPRAVLGGVMSNPLAKKNPLMSLWFSGANQVLGKGRAMAHAEARRQQAAAVTEGTKAITAFWSGFFTAVSKGNRPKNGR